MGTQQEDMKKVSGTQVEMERLLQPHEYELDWGKVKTLRDVTLLLMLIAGTSNKPVYLMLTGDLVHHYRHLFKDGEKEERVL